MSNSGENWQSGQASAGPTDEAIAANPDVDNLISDSYPSTAPQQEYDLGKELNNLAPNPAVPAVEDELDILEPKPVHLTAEQQSELRGQAANYKKYAEELEKNFYEQQQYYILSARWLKRWKVYVSYQEVSKDLPSSKHIGSGKLPPVNADIIETGSQLDFQFGGAYEYLDNALKPGLKQNVNYVIVSKSMWEIFTNHHQHFVLKRYMAETKDGKKVEVYFYRVHGIALYNEILKDIERQYLRKFTKINFQLPKYKPLTKDFLEVLTKKIKSSIKKLSSLSYGFTDFSKDNARLWVVDDELTERQFMNHLTKACRANTSYSYKIFFPGDLLDVTQKSIEQLQLNQEAIIALELKQDREEWTFFNKQNMPYAKCDCCRDIKQLSVICSCNNAVYCSKDCKTKDKYSHRYKCDRDGESSEEEKALAMTEASKKGIMGLRNLGNTCFMNSGIQCLTSVDTLTEYFLSNKYIPDINEKNPIGTKGELSKAYAKLLQKMWYGEESAVAPSILKRAIGKFQPMFVGYEQHDSGELISYLLDGLHEDLNRVKDKPYTQTKDYDGRPDIVVAKQSWETFLLRNRSVIVDLMYGQYKSRLECPKCAKVSVTFDPFLMVPLPVPQDDSKIFQAVYEKEDHIATVKIEISYKKTDNLKLSDIASRIAAMLNVPNEMICVGVSYYESKLLDMKLDANTTRKEYKHKTILYRQKEPSQNLQTGVAVNILQTLCNSLYGNENYRRNIIKPRILVFDPNTTAKQVHQRFFKYWGHMLGIEDYEKDIINATAENQKWRILLVTKSSYEFCQFCEKNSCYNCPLPYSDDITIKDLVEKCDKFKEKHKLQFEIYWRKGAEEVQKTFEKAETVASKSSKPSSSNHISSACPTIYDCLKLAQEPQTLGQDNAWYCPTCKQFVLATKQMSIYKAPKVLILSFKRFKNKGYFKSKLTTLIDFPIDDLDISAFVINNDLPEAYFKEPQDGVKPSTHYSLFAISNHYGGLGGGHYTAYCRKEGSRWYEFDDGSVTPVSEDRLVDSASYVLFYRKKE